MRGNGIRDREKYRASPTRLQTTFTVAGLSSSAAGQRHMSEAIVRRESATSGAATRSIDTGSISGSSPWILTMMSASTLAAASARRSVPERCVSDVITADPPNPVTTSYIARSCVATSTSRRQAASRARSQTRWIIGLPPMSSSGLSGNRVAASRAGMIPTICKPPRR